MKKILLITLLAIFSFDFASAQSEKKQNSDATQKTKKRNQAYSDVRRKVAGKDKIVGKDDKGRTIYQGEKGGKYYINENANKVYIKD
jgi:colicin import membrane protein